MQPVITNNIEAIRALCKQHHVKELYVFGSAVRDDFNEESDVDFLYVFDLDDFNLQETPGQWPYSPFAEFFKLKNGLEVLMARKVDVISYNDISSKVFKEMADKEKELVYAKTKPQFISV
jgi:predicted nucleotidyltransferase